MKVILLTEEQANMLHGQEVVPSNYFNCIKDAQGRWIISVEERDQCSIEWVKSCPEIEYEPVITELPI